MVLSLRREERDSASWSSRSVERNVSSTRRPGHRGSIGHTLISAERDGHEHAHLDGARWPRARSSRRSEMATGTLISAERDGHEHAHLDGARWPRAAAALVTCGGRRYLEPEPPVRRTCTQFPPNESNGIQPDVAFALSSRLTSRRCGGLLPVLAGSICRRAFDWRSVAHAVEQRRRRRAGCVVAASSVQSRHSSDPVGQLFLVPRTGSQSARGRPATRSTRRRHRGA